MANQTLSIKVHVDLPSAGELERDLQKSLDSLKDHETNLTIDPRIGHVQGLGKIEESVNHIKETLDNMHGNINFTGENDIANLTRRLKEFRELAERPINLRIDDSNISQKMREYREAQDQSDLLKSQQALATKYQENMADQLRQVQQHTKAVHDYEKRAAQAKNDELAEIYRDGQRQATQAQAEAMAEYRANARSAGVSADEIENRLSKATAMPYKAKIQIEEAGLKKAESDLRQLQTLINKVNGLRIKGLKAGKLGQAEYKKQFEEGNAEIAAMEARINSSGIYQDRINKMHRQAEATYNLAYANHQDQKARGYRGPGGRNVTTTMDAWDMLQQGGMAAAYIADSINQVDKAITKVTKVVPDGAKAIAGFRKSIFKEASSVGKSAPDYANAVEQWATAGFNLKRSRALAKRSVMGSFVGDVDVNDMVNYMSVPLNSFKRQKLKADDIINSMNQVSNKHAVEMVDLGQAYSKASAVLSSTGTNFHQLTGMITGAQEATRAGGDIVGRSIKAIAQNFAKMSSGQTRGDRNKAAFFEDKLKVHLKDANGEMKSTYDVMDQLAKKWHTMSDQDKQNAALYAAGKEHSAQFTGMLDNWDTVKKATAESEAQAGLGKEGSAYQEFAKQRQSLDFQLNKLKNTWGSFINGVGGGRKGMAGMVGDLNGLLGVADKLAANQLFSGATRWVAMAGGWMLARRSLARLSEGFKDFVTNGSDATNVFDRFFGISSKNDRLKSSLENFKDAIGTSKKEQKTSSSDGFYVPETTNTSTTKTKSKNRTPKSGKEMRMSAEASGLVFTNGAKRELDAIKPAQSMSKMARIGSIAKAGMGVLGASLGYLGLFADAAAITSFAFNALNFHPLEKMNDAMHPAIRATQDLNKELDKTSKSVFKTNQAIDSNGLLNGNFKAGVDGVKNIQDAISGLSGKLDDDTFKNIKDQYNEIAKANGLETRIKDDNDASNVSNKVNALHDTLEQVKKSDIADASETLTTQLDNVSKTLDKGSIQKLLNSSDAYQKAVAKAETTKTNVNGTLVESRKPLTNAQRQKINDEFSYGSKNAAIWNSAEGKKVAKIVKEAQKGMRSIMSGLGDDYLSGTITKDDFMGMSQTGQQATALGLLSNFRYFKGKSKNDAEVSKAFGQIKETFGALGFSNKQLNSLQDNALNGENGKILKSLLNSSIDSDLVAGFAGIGAQYQSQHKFDKGGWRKAAIRDQTSLDDYLKQHPDAKNTVGLIDPNTGFENFDSVAAFNAGATTRKNGRRIIASMGGKYGTNGADSRVMDMSEALRLTTGLDGDALQIMSQVATGSASTYNTLGVAANGLGKGAKGDDIARHFVSSKGASNKLTSRDDFVYATNQAMRDGIISTQQAESANAWYENNFTQKGKAKTLEGFRERVGGQKLTTAMFKKEAAALSNKERRAAIKAAQKDGSLTSSQAKQLRNDRKWLNQRQKNGRGSTESTNLDNTAPDNLQPESDHGVNHGSSKGKGKSKPKGPGKFKNTRDKDFDGNSSAQQDVNNAVAGLSRKKGKVSQKQLQKALKSYGLNGTKGAEKEAYRQLAEEGKLSKSAQKSLAKKYGKVDRKKSPWEKFKDWLMPPAESATRDKTASQRMKTLNKKYGDNKKLSSKDLKKAEAGLTKKEQDKLARQLAKDGRLTKSGKSYASKKNKVDVKKAEKEGKAEEKARQKGRDSVSKQAAQHKKNEAKKAVKDAEKQGKQEGKAKNKGSESSGKSKNSSKGKNKVKVTADTKDLKSKLKSAGKNAKVKVKVIADTKSFKSKIKSAGKGTKVKVKVNADTKGMKSKIKSAGKTKVKVKVDANTSAMKSKIKSAVSSIKAKVKVTADVSGVRSKIKSAVSNVKATVKVSVSGNVGKLNAIKSAINGIQSKSVKVKASVSGTSKVRQLRSAINGVHSKSVSVKAKVSGLGEVKALGAAIDALHDKSVSVSVTKHETTIKTTKGKSIAVTPETVLGANPLKSMSVVASDPALAAAIQNGASNMGVDANSMSNGASVTDYSDSTENVSEDYWRYMDKELYTGLPLDEQVNKLENAVTQADEDMDKLISLSKQRIDVDNKQIAYQKQMQGAYQQQITDMINKLHAYGFQSNGNKITNLGHAKDIHGDNASKVDDLLGKYQSAYQNFSEATQKIQELQTDIWQQGKNQEDYRNTKDQKMVEKLQRDLELLTTAIENHRSILERQASSLGDADYVMKNKNSADQINSKSNDMYSLLQEFNKLALTNFVGTKEADNAKNLLESMQSMKETIMEYADAIDELKRSMMDNAIQMAAENMSKAVDNLNDSTSRMENNVDNLKEGLLSGTDFADLESSKLNDLDLTQLSDYQKGVKARVGLEQQLDKVLDNFAKKNVDRTAQVANQELQINYQKYEELVKMAQDFATKQMVGIDPIRVKYEAQGSSEDLEIPGLTHDKEYLEVIGKYQTLMNSIRIDHEEKLKRINSEEEKEALNQDMVYKQLALQQQVYESLIELDRQKIADDQKLLQTADLTTEERQKLNDEITEYGNNIEEAQNNIKKAIKGRFDYEKELLDKQFDEYSRISTLMSNMVTIADALHLDGETQANIIGKQYEATYQEYRQYLHVLSSLRNELSKYEKGSFEYNQLDAVVKEYQSTLDSKVTQLLDITKDEFGQHLEAVKKAFEKNVNEGMTADQAKFDQDVWYSQSQKELRLEEMRLKIVELEDKTVEKRINALDAQDKLSKAEADYVDKQLDLALAQQKLNNTINQKDVHYLDKDENGKWEWRYTADQQQVDAARQEVNQARQAIEDAKISNRNDYIAKVEEVIDRIKNGTVDPAEAKSQLEQLNNSYKFILKDIPDFDVTKTEDILQAYNDYVKKNNQIMNDYKGSANVANNQGFKEIVEGFGEQFKMVSKDLGEIFGKQLQQVLNLPNGSRNNYGQGKDNSVVIQNLNLELPNVHNVNEFAKALDTLPQVAAQYASQK